jgi:uncharacterized protein YcbK (DUF882 family)
MAWRSLRLGKGFSLVFIRSRRRVAGAAFAALFAAFGAHGLVANSDRARTISLYNIHTKETVTVLYKQDGRYIPEAMEKINWALRDWRKNEPTKMDPALVDLLWEVHTELGSAEPIHIISGYRSRGTNEMLRKNVGGQASESRHILGKAADVHFPDVPLKRMRYSALVRERGGVGYYPTSALPFVHLDTDRVRSWPRLPRYELALLFPSGRTQHQPAEGGAITREDVQVAQAKHRELAVQVAEFLDTRNRPAVRTQVAALTPSAVPLAAATPAVRPVPPPVTVAALAPAPASPQVNPRLAVEPRLIDRSSRLTQPTADERAKLAQLVALASFEPQLVTPPKTVARPAPAQPALASLTGTALWPARGSDAPAPAAAQVAALAPSAALPAPANLTDAGLSGLATVWAHAPEFDEEHPDELSYRPFPVAPYMTASASPDDPALVHLVHPDAARSLELLDQAGTMPPMRLRPTPQVAQLLLAQSFSGGLADIGQLFDTAAAPDTSGVNSRAVKTGAR